MSEIDSPVLPTSAKPNGRMDPLGLMQAAPASGPASQEKAAEPPDVQSQSLTRLLEIAEHYYADGLVRHAREMFFQLAEDYPETPQGRQSVQNLLGMADRFRAAGELHQARAIYQKIL